MMEQIIKSFQQYLPCEWNPQEEQIEILNKLVDYANANKYSLSQDYESSFVEAVNQKLELNKDVYKSILDAAFIDGVKLNYLLKSEIKRLLDSCKTEEYFSFLVANGIDSEKMKNAFLPISVDETLKAASHIFKSESKSFDVYCSIFSRFVFNLFPKECTYRFFSSDETAAGDFFDYISNKYPDIAKRDNALSIIDVSAGIFNKGYVSGCNIVANAIKKSFQELNNHCDLAIYIPPIECEGENIQWKLYADSILYAEKHVKEKIDRAYFRWKKIGETTLNYIESLNAFNSEFEYAFQGFVFKDCFVIGGEVKPYALLLIFEKNVRDERIINCPACRSSNIQGNSYPILNVRSWECENPLCPDRSKYNRGKRYAYMSLFRQKEMQNDENLIPETSISKWHLDCLHEETKDQAIEMIIRHYSCVNDTVSIYSNSINQTKLYNRHIVLKKYDEPKTDLISIFKKSAYFYRYIQYHDKREEKFTKYNQGNATIYCGDSLDVLRTIKSNSIAGAVTSPPYYNAKSYSQWANIYCYLYDMYNINLEIFRVLKEGGVYLYNIFDYFDNENNIVLSAMGNKRMILGAYMIDMFQRIGFKIEGNVIWNKGEIQGNRSFNQGNLTPYYQAPLNCWEHIIVLSKGKADKKYKSIVSSIADIKPVIKMIRGKNVLGHDAPFPIDIPDILIRCMNSHDKVLDPFLGSGTTCISANRSGVKSIGIEKSEQYFELCKKLISTDYYQTELF